MFNPLKNNIIIKLLKLIPACGGGPTPFVIVSRGQWLKKVKKFCSNFLSNFPPLSDTQLIGERLVETTG